MTATQGSGERPRVYRLSIKLDADHGLILSPPGGEFEIELTEDEFDDYVRVFKASLAWFERLLDARAAMANRD